MLWGRGIVFPPGELQTRSRAARLIGAINQEQKMTKYLKTFIRDESGATAIEYGLIASLIGVAIIAGVRVLGTNLSGTFAKVSGNLA